ncbi:hypothetical protein KI387_012914, partial [Taxus chinensis]
NFVERPNATLWRRVLLHHTMVVRPPAPDQDLRILDHYLFPTRPHLQPDNDGTAHMSRVWLEQHERQLPGAPQRHDSSSSSDDDTDPPGPS